MGTAMLEDQAICQKIAQQLGRLLADTYVLYVKTQNFHWNIIDERFFSLHKMLDEQYHALAEANDDIAERIRALKQPAPATLQQFLELTSLEEPIGTLSGNEMLQQLINDHTTIAENIRPWISKFQKEGDEGSADLLIERLRYHEKTAWMLRSHF